MSADPQAPSLPPSPHALRTWRVKVQLAELHFSVQAPVEWQPVSAPTEIPDFNDVHAFAGIALIAAPYAAVIFAVGARPAYADGTLAEWLEHNAHANGQDPSPIELEEVGPHAAVACWGAQNVDGMLIRNRLVMFEDGGRIVTLSCTAPEALWPAVGAGFAAMVRSFALDEPRGSQVDRARAGLELPPSSLAPLAAAAATRAPQAPAPSAARPASEPVAGLALATDQASFDQDQPMNARLRDAGAGLVPNVLDHHDQEHWATLAPAALCATLRVPFGWHVIDDGRRTLVFDAAGKTQINLHLTRRHADGDGPHLDAKLRDLYGEWPTLEWARFEAMGLPCLAIRNVLVNGAPVEQVYLLRDAQGAGTGLVLEARVTSTAEGMPQALELVEFLLGRLAFLGDGAPEEPRAPRAEPVWWTRALELERADDLPAAEQCVLDALDHLGAYAQLAELCERRARRLAEAGDKAGAKAAEERAAHWLRVRASQATSGGEGAAFSTDRR
ncbi:MAG: hypothetical protein IT457_07000 [Planctomycetes bacterium]|nr:hypothetical protein [Planctomycetota bacterium]